MMRLTLLFDLDDTLLSNNMDTFLPAYLQSLAASANQVSPRLFISSLLVASEGMVRKSQISGTLENEFDSHFYPAIGASKTQMRETIDFIYQDIYPSLRTTTHPFPEAQGILNDLVSSGHQIVIATNPLFPATAVKQRLDWAGLENLQLKFDIITSFENFHFAKPHPEYFAEILAQLAWPDQPVLMIGNSLENDIIPAESIGLPTFFISDHQPIESASRHPLSSNGKLIDIPVWLKKVTAAAEQTFALTHSGYLASLKVTPGAAETIIKRIHQSNMSLVQSLLSDAVCQDNKYLEKNNIWSNSPVNLSSVSQSFFESRTRLLDKISN